MLRCDRCRGHAHAGLAHLHGLPVPLCKDCTDKELERQVAQRAVDALKADLEPELTHNAVRAMKAA